MIIREATPEDVAEVLRIGSTFLKESWRHALVEDEAQLRAFAVDLVTGDDTTILIADAQGSVRGILGLQMARNRMSGRGVSIEVIWWVEPDARGGRAAIKLVEAAKAWSREMGAWSLQMAAPIHAPVVARICAKLGGQPLETLYQFMLGEAA